MANAASTWRRAMKLAQLIEGLPDTKGKPYQECNKEQKARMMLELAFKELTGRMYVHQWYVENKDYL